MNFDPDFHHPLIVALLCNLGCALLGCLLVLRKQSLLGDAISHAVLPGIVGGYLVIGSLNSGAILLGAAVVGILTAWLSERLQTLGKVGEDASLGIVFTSLFALGVIMIARYASKVDLDPGCVFYGALELASLKVWRWEFVFNGQARFVEIPQAAPTLAFMLLLTILVLIFGWKEWKIIAFDENLARAVGIKVGWFQTLLMAMLSAMVVVSFEAVGSILVVAMLIVPAATARLLTDRYLPTFLWSAAVATVITFIGVWLATYYNLASGGMLAVVAGSVLALAVLFSPKQGVVARGARRLALAIRIREDDLISRLYRLEEAGDLVMPIGGNVRWLSWWLCRRGYLQREGTGFSLTEAGRKRGWRLVRGHRLWESYLDENFALPSDHLHESAHEIEHFLDDAAQQALVNELKESQIDPHGRVIPTEPLTKSSFGNSKA